MNPAPAEVMKDGGLGGVPLTDALKKLAASVPNKPLPVEAPKPPPKVPTPPPIATAPLGSFQIN
jgi:hypothetical protein